MSRSPHEHTTQPPAAAGALDDRQIARLREAIETPDLEGTRYRLVRELGRGGMGTVFLVEDRELGREVALKVLSIPEGPDEGAGRALSARLLNEARLLARLEHPHVVPVHDAGALPDGRVFYVMKYVRGQRLDAWRAEQGRPALLRVFLRICDAVAFAHDRGILHRDLKPENVMVGPFGEALVLDWGVARVFRAGAESSEPAPGPRVSHQTGSTPVAGKETAGPEEAATGVAKRAPDSAGTGSSEHGTGHGTREGTIVGTAGWMAPEQARGEIRALDERTDVHGLGGILYFMLTGQAPQGDGSPRAVRRDIPRSLDAVCAKALRPEPAGRYGGVPELARDVERFLEGEPVSARRESPFEWAGRVAAKNAPILWLVAAYLLMRSLWLLYAGR